MPCKLTFIILLLFVSFSEPKTISGTLSSKNARLHWGQIIGDFMFSGENGAIFYEITAGSPFSRRFHLYRRDEYMIDDEADTCKVKLGRATDSFAVEAKGNRTVSKSQKADTWVLVYSDQNSCVEDTLSPDKPRVHEELARDVLAQYVIRFYNADKFGMPTCHFSADKFGLKIFYQVLTLVYFVVACIFAPKLVQILGNRGPMYMVLCLLTGAALAHALGALIMLLHLQRFSNDGYGSRFLQDCAELLDLMSQLLMLHMLISVSLGWTLSGQQKPSHLDSLKTKPASKIVGSLAFSQLILFIWEQTQDLNHRLHHPPSSVAGVSLLVLRVALAIMFAGNLILVIKFERSALKKDFYNYCARICVAWFVCYPMLLLISWTMSDYYSYKFLTFSVVLCQMCVIVALYRLFLARSLFWEVSALSTYLPLKPDKKRVKSLSIKIHS